MKQWNLRMKKLWSKTLLVKPWLKRTEMKRPVHICENFSKKAIRIVVRLVTLKMLKYSMAYTIKFHCLWGNVLSAANKKLSPNFFGKVWTMHVYIYIYVCVCVCVCVCMYVCFISIWISIYRENVNWKTIFYDSDKIENRLPFYRSLFSTFWNRVGGLCTQVFYFH